MFKLISSLPTLASLTRRISKTPFHPHTRPTLHTLLSSFLNISISRPWLIEEEEILWKSREEEERARAGILRSTISNDFWGSNEDLLEEFFRIFGLGVEFFGLN
jgi:hypothetical protein